jgi:PEP-CTERM motif
MNKKKLTGVLTAGSLFLGISSSAMALTLTFTQISTPFNNPIGIDYYEPSNSVVMSVNYPSGQPRNFETVQLDGSHSPFSTVSGFTDEVKIATVRSTAQGGFGTFSSGDLFVGNGIDGQIARITNNGTTVINPWVDLPNSGNGLMRGSLYVDRTGVYNGDLIAATTNGEVWRIDSSGTPTMLADVNTHLEGLMTVPNDPVYGGLAGKIIAGAENTGLMYVFDNNGFVTTYNLGVAIEDIDMINANENFFGVNYGSARLLGVEASQFSSVVGNILLTSEFGGQGGNGSGLYHMYWDTNQNKPVAELIDFAAGTFNPSQWEHVTFAPAGIREIPPTTTIPEPATLILMSLGLIGIGAIRRR